MAESNWTMSGYRPDEHGWWKATIDDRGDFGYPIGYYFADTLRAIMVAFTNFFNDLYVIRYDEKGFPRKRIQVPIKFGPRAKSHDFRKEQESGKTYYIPLPNMYYQITSFQYDATRAASSMACRTFYENYLMDNEIDERQAQLLWSDTKPVPYNFGFTLTAKAEKMSDLLQMIEQICTRFNPDAFLFIKEFWFMNIRRSIKMKLDSVDTSMPEEMGEQDKREVEAKFHFTIEGWLYTKIEYGAVIDQIIVTLNPSIAVYKTQQIVNVLSGSKDPENPEFYIADSADLPIKDAGIIKWKEELEPGVSVWTPDKNYEAYFELAQKDQGIWKFTSAVESEEADRYKSIIGISGNYMEQSGTYDSAARSWDGSMTERYDFSKLTEDDYTASGRKDYLNSNNERVDTHWFMKHDTEIAD